MIQHDSTIFTFPGSSVNAEAELVGAARASLLARHVLAEPCVGDLGAVQCPLTSNHSHVLASKFTKCAKRLQLGKLNQYHKLINHYK